MRKICLLLFIMGLFAFSFTEKVFAKSDDSGLCYTNFSKKELLNDLDFAERQVYKKIYNNKSMTERLENLELSVFGAIQSGEEDFRIKKLKNAVTNVASGGKGLQYVTKAFNLAESTMGNSTWSIGNMHNYYPRSYYGNRYGQRGYKRRMPHCPCHSHRLPPPPPYNNSYNPIGNGNFSQNYSMGTSIKILDD